MGTDAKNISPQRSIIGTLILISLVALAFGIGPLEAAETSKVQVTCNVCHAEQAEQFSRSVHLRAGFDCRQCHGGEEKYHITSEKLGTYMQDTSGSTALIRSRPYFDHGPAYRGKATRSEVSQRCGDCHSDVEAMNPYGLRTDQLARYKTSGHGKGLYINKDEKVAVCIDCHDTHEVLKTRDPASPVHPLHIPDTCGRCHNDQSLMARYGLSVKVVGDYKASIHGRKLLKDGDLAMPTCATCHGNHAAQPPGFDNIGHVCGQCHANTQKYFEQSAHARFGDFSPCVACHGLDLGKRAHLIEPVIVSPEDVVESYGSMWEDLVARGKSDEQIDEIIGRQMLEDDQELSVRLGNLCVRCHSEEGKHRFGFEQLDQGAISKGQKLDDLIRATELEYVKAVARTEQVGRGILQVQDEAFNLSQARTHLISLAAIQHTLDEKQIADVAEKVLDVCRKVQSSLDQKERGLGWRYQALMPIWVFLSIFIVILWIKYKQLKKAYAVPAGTVSEDGQ